MPGPAATAVVPSALLCALVQLTLLCSTSPPAMALLAADGAVLGWLAANLQGVRGPPWPPLMSAFGDALWTLGGLAGEPGAVPVLRAALDGPGSAEAVARIMAEGGTGCTVTRRDTCAYVLDVLRRHPQAEALGAAWRRAAGVLSARGGAATVAGALRYCGTAASPAARAAAERVLLAAALLGGAAAVEGLAREALRLLRELEGVGDEFERPGPGPVAGSDGVGGTGAPAPSSDPIFQTALPDSAMAVLRALAQRLLARLQLACKLPVVDGDIAAATARALLPLLRDPACRPLARALVEPAAESLGPDSLLSGRSEGPDTESDAPAAVLAWHALSSLCGDSGQPESERLSTELRREVLAFCLRICADFAKSDHAAETGGAGDPGCALGAAAMVCHLAQGAAASAPAAANVFVEADVSLTLITLLSGVDARLRASKACDHEPSADLRLLGGAK